MPSFFTLGSRSLTQRALTAVLAAQVLLTLGLLSTVLLLARQRLRAGFDSELIGHAIDIAALVRYPETGKALVFDISLLPPSRNDHPDLYAVRQVPGRFLGPPPTFPLPPAGRFWDFTWNGAGYRGYALRHFKLLDTEEDWTGPPARVDVFYAKALEPMHEALLRLAAMSALAAALLLLFTWWLTRRLLRRALTPLRELAANAAHISVQHWEFEPPVAAARLRELSPLTAALSRALDRLHQAFVDQRQFLGDAAHELKTPVAVLKTALQALLRQPRGAEAYRQGLETALDDVARLERLLQRLLQLERLEHGRPGPAPAPAPTSVPATCEPALLRLRPLAETRGVELQLCEMPEWAAAADPGDLEQIWTNLLENALQHSPAGSAIAMRGSVGWVEIEDHGCGIPAADLPYIFERYHRAASPLRTSGGGLGLGLAIVRALVESLGGQVEIQSQVGRGTRVRVTLPAA